MTANSHSNHNHTPNNLSQINNAFYIGIFLNALYTAIEFVVGINTNSLALISDATHNLSDVATLIISLIGMRLAQKSANLLYTYGYKKASIIASMLNAVLLLTVVFGILKSALARFSTPPEVTGKVIIITALIGVFINTISAYLFYKGQKDDINIRGAFLHLMVDALVSVGVVISGIIIYYTQWYIIDTLISIAIAVVILFSTWGLFMESIKLSLDGIPNGIDLIEITKTIKKVDGVKAVYHVHIWALSTSENALTTHITIDNKKSVTIIKNEIKHQLEHEKITHVTIEVDAFLEHDNETCS